MGGQTPEAVSQAVGVCPHTVRKWVDRYNSEGLAGLQDRSSRPRRLHRPPAPPVIDRIEARERASVRLLTTVSARLQILHAARLIARRRKGKSVIYSIAGDHDLTPVENAVAHAGEKQ